jgi:hypothetical protein
MKNEDIIPMVRSMAEKERLLVVYEDIAYVHTGGGPDLVATIKFIGVLVYNFGRLRRVRAVGIPRSRVRAWVYRNMREVCEPLVAKRIKYLDEYGAKNDGKRYLQADGVTLRKPSHQFVDDRIVISAMRAHYQVPIPKPGKTNVYGLRSHSWQALAVATCYLGGGAMDPV